MAAQLEALVADARRAFAGRLWRARFAALVPGLDPADLPTAIHPGDQMLLHSLAHHRSVDVALSQYAAISAQQFQCARQVVRTVFDPAAGPVSFLDFACGYGRLLRLLHAEVPRECTWASDIQPAAVEFVSRSFGVRGLLSHAVPAHFETEQRFDVIWVASLFSHLPEALFHQWLLRLTQLLSDRGVLCFSVRDISQLPDGIAAGTGFVYAPESETDALDSSIYGTAYADEHFVSASVASVSPQHRVARVPRALANEQDLYVATRSGEVDLERVKRLRRGPWGWVDLRRIGPDGGLDLQGWAASLDDGDVEQVEVRVQGETHRIRPSIRRDDVAAAFADPRMGMSGWSLRLPVPSCAPGAQLEVTATDRQRAVTLLYGGSAIAV